MREYVVNRPDEAAMRRVLEAEPISPEGVILRLAWQQAVADLLAYTAENRVFYLSVLKNRGRAGLQQVLGGAVENSLRSALTYYQERSGAPPNPAAEQARLLWWRTMVLTLLEDWLEGNLCQPPEEVIDLLEQDLRDGMAGAAWRSLARSDTME